MRELRQIGEQKVRNLGYHNLTEDVLIQLGEFLNSREGRHIDYIYFDKSNDWYINSYPYVGPDKAYRNKRYIRFREVITEVERGVGRRDMVPNEDYEVIKEYESTELLDMYEKLLKKRVK